MLTLLAAFDLLRNKKPAEVTADEVAGLRERLQASPPSMFAPVGGVEAVERFLAEAEEALQAQEAAAAVAAQQAASAPKAAEPRDRRLMMRKIEVALYAVVVAAAAGGLYAFLRQGDDRKRADTGGSAAVEQSSSATQPTQAVATDKPEPAPPDEPPDEPPGAEERDPDVWLGWKMARGMDGTALQKEGWDTSDPSNSIPAVNLEVSGPLRLSRKTAIGEPDRWLLVDVRPLHAVAQGGQIEVIIDGQSVAKASIGTGQSDWPLYVPLSDSKGAPRLIEVNFTPGAPHQRIVFWDLRMVKEQLKKPQPESPVIADLRSADPAVRLRGVNSASQVVETLALGALVRLLGDANRDVRRATVLALMKYSAGAPPFVNEALIGKLADADQEIRLLASQVLLQFDTAATWQALSQAMLTHPDVQLRMQIAQQVAGRQHPLIRAAYEKLADHPEDGLRLIAVTNLAHNPNPATTALLIRALDDPEPSVRRTAMSVLIGRRDETAEAAIIKALESHADMHVRRAAMTRFQTLPTPKALPALKAALASPDDLLRRTAIAALARLPGNESDALLLELANSTDPATRQSATDVLAMRPGQAAEDRMIAALTSGQETWQRPIALRRFALPPFLTPRVIPALREALKSPSATVRFELVGAILNVRLAQLQLAMQSGQSRAAALETLAKPPWSETFTLMVQMLDDPHPRVRAAAAGVLRGDPHPDADAIMPRLLTSPDVQVRQLAAGRFPRYAMSSPKMMDFYKACLKDPDPVVRACAVEALILLRTPQSQELVKEAYDDPASSVREMIQASWRVDPGKVRDEALLPAEAKGPAPQAVPVLVKLLSHPKPSMRSAAALKLAQIPDEAAGQALLTALNTHPDVFVRLHAVSVLSRKPPTPPELDKLRQLVRDPDTQMREAALSIAARTPGPDAVAIIAPLLSDPVPNVRLTAATLLSAMPAPAADDAVLPLLNHPDWQIRQQAVQRFARTPSPRAIPGLGEAAVAPEREIAIEALRALGQSPDPAVAPLLARALDSPDDGVRATAAELLRVRGGPEAIAMMQRALESHPRIDVRHLAAMKFEAQPTPAALSALAAAAKHEDDGLRMVALRALGRLSEPAATAPLVEALADAVPEVRQTAAQMLMQRRDDAAEAAIISALQSHNDIEIRRIATTRFHGIPTPKAVPALAEALKNVDDQLRRLAVQALQHTAVPEAIDPLIAALNDPSSIVRQMAVGALTARPDPRAKAAVAAFQAKNKS